MQNCYVIHKKTGKLYKVISEQIQTKNRLQVTDPFVIGGSERYTSSKLEVLDFNSSLLCLTAHKILKAKKKMTNEQKRIVEKYRQLKQKVMV